MQRYSLSCLAFIFVTIPSQIKRNPVIFMFFGNPVIITFLQNKFYSEVDHYELKAESTQSEPDVICDVWRFDDTGKFVKQTKKC